MDSEELEACVSKARDLERVRKDAERVREEKEEIIIRARTAEEYRRIVRETEKAIRGLEAHFTVDMKRATWWELLSASAYDRRVDDACYIKCRLSERFGKYYTIAVIVDTRMRFRFTLLDPVR